MRRKVVLKKEAQRVNVFKACPLLNELPESDFDGITELAAAICQVPISLITFAVDNRQIFKSHFGVEISEANLDESFCIRVIDAKKSLIVEDSNTFFTKEDIPISAEKYNVRFYVGLPLFDKHGNVLGTLCVLDHYAKSITDEQLKALGILANQVTKLIELRMINQQLLESENAYKSLFDQNPDAVFSFDLNGRFLSANSVLLNMLNTTIEELHKTTYVRFILPSQLDRVLMSFKKACQGEPQNYDVIINSSNDEKLVLNITNIPNIQSGKIVGVFGIAKDITEKEKLQENLSMILSNTKESFMIINRDLEIIFFNKKAASETKQLLQKELKRGMNVFELSHPDRIPLLRMLYREVFKGSSKLIEVDLEDSNGVHRWFANSFSPVQNDEGIIEYVTVTVVEITESKKAQIKLEQSERGLRQAQAITNIGNWDFDFTTEESIWSDQLFQILGFEPGEIEPSFGNYLKMVHPDDLDFVSKLFEFSTDNLDLPRVSKHRIFNKTGDERIVYLENRYIEEGGSVKGMYGILHDITEKHKSEETLRNSEEKSRLLMNASLDAIIWIDSKASILDCNPQAEKTFGWKKEEVLYHNLVEIIAPPHHKSQYVAILEAYNRHGDESFMNQLVEQKAIDHNKNEFPIELTVIPVQQNEDVFFAVFIRNISERKRFSDELKMSEKRYRNMFYMSPLPMWVCDLEARFLDVNEAAIKHYGFSREEFLKMSFFDLSPEKNIQSKKNFIENVIEAGFFRGETLHLTSNGRVIEVDLQCSEIDFASQKARLVLAIDVTQEKYNERKLKSMTRELEEQVLIRTNELNQANELLSYEYQQTRDSIIYAKNIQSSILHKDKDLELIFPNSFVFFKPKDKVSGDFLWCAENEDYYLVAVVDCTGHGVPGAMISMVGFQLLNQIVIINGINSPSAVLTVLDKEINDLFNYNSKKSSSDGMDMIFCRVSKHTNEIDFAGAQRPLFYYNPSEGLQEFKGNKLAIGGFQYNMGDKSFVETKITYQKGDVLYLTSDGYYSQFGGPGDKMMLKKRMIEQLELIGHEEMNVQKEHLSRFFREWKGNEEQIDDVLVVGIKL